MNLPGPDGVPPVEHLLAVYEQTGCRPEALDGPEFPSVVGHLWTIYRELSASRGGNGFSPNPLTSWDILGWMNLSGVQLMGWEIKALHQLDQTYLKVVAEKSSG